MVGYSGTPLIKKLGIKEGYRILIQNEPEGFRKELGRLPLGVVIEEDLKGEFAMIHSFVKEEKVLDKIFPVIRMHIRKDGVIWISWLKNSRNGVSEETDLNENKIRDIGLRNGMVDVKVVAVDDRWSALKFVYRLIDR